MPYIVARAYLIMNNLYLSVILFSTTSVACYSQLR